MARASRSAAPGACDRNKEGSASSSSRSIGAPVAHRGEGHGAVIEGIDAALARRRPGAHDEPSVFGPSAPAPSSGRKSASGSAPATAREPAERYADGLEMAHAVDMITERLNKNPHSTL